MGRSISSNIDAYQLQEYWRFFVGPVLTIPLLFLPRVWRRRRSMFVALSGALFAMMLEGAATPHYIAIAIAAIVGDSRRIDPHMRRCVGDWRAMLYAMIGVLTLRIGAQSRICRTRKR